MIVVIGLMDDNGNFCQETSFTVKDPKRFFNYLVFMAKLVIKNYNLKVTRKEEEQ